MREFGAGQSVLALRGQSNSQSIPRFARPGIALDRRLVLLERLRNSSRAQFHSAQSQVGAQMPGLFLQRREVELTGLRVSSSMRNTPILVENRRIKIQIA